MASINEKVRDAAKAPQATNTAPQGTNTAPRSPRPVNTEPRKTAEVQEPSDEQEQTLESQLSEAQEATQKGLLSIAQANSDVLSEQVLDATENLLAFKIIKGMGARLEGEHGVTAVTTSFLYGTSRSGYQLKDAIANLAVAPPLLYGVIDEMTEEMKRLKEEEEMRLLNEAAVAVQPLLNAVPEPKQVEAA
jgi:hypothetical protein